MKFCDKCESMLIPKKEDNKTVFACNSCGWVSSKKENIVISEKCDLFFKKQIKPASNIKKGIN